MKFPLLFLVLQMTSAFAGDFTNDTDIAKLTGLRGTITAELSLPVKDGDTYRRYFLKGAALESEISFWDSLYTYCWIESKTETLSAMSFIISDVGRADGWWMRKNDSRVLLKTDAGFEIVCSRGANTWRTPVQVMSFTSNGMRLRNLKHAFGASVKFD